MQVGKTYKINHTRKGRFSIRVESNDGEWVKGLVVSGKAGAMMAHNEREAGEEITVRKSLISSFEEVV